MNLTEILKISLRALRVNKVRSILTMLGIIIGVASVIVLVSLVSGLEKTIRDELNRFGANLIIVFPGDQEGGHGPGGVTANKLEFRFVDLVKLKVPEVLEMGSVIESIGLAEYKNKQLPNTLINGVSGNFFNSLNIGIDLGRPFGKNEGGNVAVIGSTVREELFNGTDPTGKVITVKSRRFKIVGVQEKRGSIFGVDQDKIVLIPIASARALLSFDRPNWFFIKGVDGEDVNEVKKKVEDVLLNEMEEGDFTVSTQEETLQLVGRILGILSAGLGGIAAISLLVGGVGIMNIMFVSVTERTKEIGLRKALGAKRRDILFQFLTEAVVLSIIGGIIGVVLGIAASVLINNFITTDVNYFFVAISFLFSFGIGIIFGITPAIRASKLSPIDALRYE